MLKIIGGEYRTRRLATPDDEALTRPYSSRARQSVFNLLRGWFEGARVLDLFAGVGTMGLEAVSRGAAKVVMVEQHRLVFKLLEKNIEELGCADRVEAVQLDALSPSAVFRAPKPVDIAFLDPPYELMRKEDSRKRVIDQARRVREVLAPKSFLVLRSPLSPEEVDASIEGFDGPETHSFGSEMSVMLYCPRPRASSEPVQSARPVEPATGTAEVVDDH
jgi:16S rRNA (guanine966-N2)-methyltransferase